MAKQVRETAAGKTISAYIVLRADGTHVATVNAHFGNSGTVSVDVWNFGESNPTRAAADETKDWGPQQRRAHGHGYDKFTAALSGLEIDGHKMTDHCGELLGYPEGLDYFPQGFQPPAGFSLANYRREGGGWASCFRLEGFKFLEAIGYRVISGYLNPHFPCIQSYGVGCDESPEGPELVAN